MIKRLIRCVLFLGLFLPSEAVTGHEIRPAYLQIIQISNKEFHVFWKIPSMGEAVPRIQPQFPPEFNLEVLNNPKQVPGSVIYSYKWQSQETLAGKSIRINGLDKTLIDVLVSVSYLNGEKITLLLQADKDEATIPGETSSWQVIKSYGILGIEHILLGIDHLLFVLALIMITRGKWKIVKTVTAFTLAHSITLSLAALGIVAFPSAPVEAVIALSIVFLALEIIKNQNGQETLTSRKPWLVAFSFGLLHGFGFAGALADIGLPQQDIPLALAFFNIGVEIGQLIFVFFLLILLWLLRMRKNWPLQLQRIPAYAIGAVSMFWVIERVLGFWP